MTTSVDMSAAQGTIAVQTHNIIKSFGSVQALRGVSITARAGEVTSIIGDNGAGKSTLIKIIAGVDRADSGTVDLYGEKVEFHLHNHGYNTWTLLTLDVQR